MDVRWMRTSARDARSPSRRPDLEQNTHPAYALVVVNVPGRRGYVYGRDEHGALQLDKVFPVAIGHGWRDNGSRKTLTGLFNVTQVHENYQTERIPSDFRGMSALRAPFGAFAIHMEPEAAGQWMHGTNALIGEVRVRTRVGPGSSGCIRCTNEVIGDLVHNVRTDTPVLRIYPSRIVGAAGWHTVRNPYRYKDLRTRTFHPREPRLSGPADALLEPADAPHGGVAGAADRLRDIGVDVEEYQD
jgi:hypothetical protein